jgi:hypothetical protein
MKHTNTKQRPEMQRDKEIDAAIDRVYKKYGTDLPAFFRDVYKELELERRESGESDKHRISV